MNRGAQRATVHVVARVGHHTNNELKTRILIDACPPMFIAAWLRLTKRWKKPKFCPSTEEWISKLKHSQKLEYYTALKTSVAESDTTERLTHTKTSKFWHMLHGWTSKHYVKWNKPDAKEEIFHLCEVPRMGKFIEKLEGGLEGEGNGKLVFNEDSFFWGKTKKCCKQIGMMTIEYHECI